MPITRQLAPRYITSHIGKTLGRSVLLAYRDKWDIALCRRNDFTCKGDALTNRDALDVEDQVGVGWDVRGRTLLAVCERSGDSEATFTSGGHAGDTDVPAFDDLADAELEGKWLALLVGCVVSVSKSTMQSE